MLFVSGQGGRQCHPESDIYERPHVLVTSPGSPERQEPSQQSLAPSIGGRIQIRLGFDPTTLQLFVTIVCAAGLQPRSPQHQRNPYCKLFLLPDRSEKSKRRTRTLAGKWYFIHGNIAQLFCFKWCCNVTNWELVATSLTFLNSCKNFKD